MASWYRSQGRHRGLRKRREPCAVRFTTAAQSSADGLATRAGEVQGSAWRPPPPSPRGTCKARKRSSTALPGGDLQSAEGGGVPSTFGILRPAKSAGLRRPGEPPRFAPFAEPITISRPRPQPASATGRLVTGRRDLGYDIAPYRSLPPRPPVPGSSEIMLPGAITSAAEDLAPLHQHPHRFRFIPYTDLAPVVTIYPDALRPRLAAVGISLSTALAFLLFVLAAMVWSQTAQAKYLGSMIGWAATEPAVQPDRQPADVPGPTQPAVAPPARLWRRSSPPQRLPPPTARQQHPGFPSLPLWPHQPRWHWRRLPPPLQRHCPRHPRPPPHLCHQFLSGCRPDYPRLACRFQGWDSTCRLKRWVSRPFRGTEIQ